ncbi:MAG TPA: ABC transporter substrate-binding protein [Gemmatimonadales bacterium]|nr:ABC transporter substrate-binding protein [Gemmatimonadales bacterium]
MCALGLEDRLVGISHGCDYPTSILHLPRLTRPRRDLAGLSSAEIDAAVRAALHEDGSVYAIDVEAISDLKPDLILTQGICDVCAVPESQVLPLSRVGTHIVTLDAHDLSAIFESIRTVGAAAGVSERAEQLVSQMQQRLAAVRTRVADRPRPRVLALEWLDPPYVPGHWVPEMIDAAGGDLLVGTTRRPSYRMEWSELCSLSPPPDVLLIMPCGFDVAMAQREAARHRADLRALGGRVQLLDASAYFSRSGPRVVDGLEILASVLHPAEAVRRPIFPA